MKLPYADLHIHSYHSDGSLSPDEIVEAAVMSGVGVLAVADHDVIEGNLETAALCKDHGIACIPAVEIDVLDGQEPFHLLAYGFEPNDKEFRTFLSHIRFLLDESNVKLVEALAKEYDSISLPDYFDYTYDRKLGGWKALHYMVSKGITSTLREGLPVYAQYGITHAVSGTSTLAAAVYRIKKAGGYAVLAHPAEMIDTADLAAFRKEIERLISMGLDGIECYYPKHTDEVTQICLDICVEKNLMVTAGSDCHGTFTGARIGAMDILVEKLALRDLLCRA